VSRGFAGILSGQRSRIPPRFVPRDDTVPNRTAGRPVLISTVWCCRVLYDRDRSCRAPGIFCFQGSNGMPLQYDRDDVKRRVVVTFKGLFQAVDVSALLDRQREDGTWSYGLLIDTRQLAGHPTIAELRQFTKLEFDTYSEKRFRGPLALVATDITIYASACVYALMARANPRKVEVFRHRDEADKWLAAHTIHPD
jgi:hypothetical protein